MGIVKRQSFKAAIVTYSGTILGIVSLVFIFPRLLSPEEFGLTRLLITLMLVYVQFPQLGITNFILRFITIQKYDAKKTSGIIFFSNLVVSVGYIIFVAFFYISENEIVGKYETNSPLFVQYYWLLIPLVFFQLFYNNLEAFSFAKSMITVPSFIKEIVIRLVLIVSAILFYFKYITFEQFLMLFVAAYGLAVLLLFIYCKWILSYSMHFDAAFFRDKQIKEYLKYALILYITNIASYFIQSFDSLFIASIVGLKQLSIYSIGLTIASIIQIPFRILAQSLIPVFSEAWANNDIRRIDDLNKKVCFNLIFIGSLFFLLIWVNVDNLFYFLPVDYTSSGSLKWIIFFIGIAKLIDVAAGMNGEIIVVSKYYIYYLYIILTTLIISYLLNKFLILSFGIRGAAIAMAASLVIFNGMKILFLKVKFNIQPFSFNGFYILIIGVITLLIMNFIPGIGNWFINGVVRSTLVLIIFVLPILLLRLSPDLEEFLKKLKAGKLLDM